MRRGFTLLEMMISLVIFSLVSLYLYQALGTLRLSNERFGGLLESGTHEERILQTLFLDLALSDGNATVHSEDPGIDTLVLRSSHSLHRRIYPYVGYVVKEKALYRIESYNPVPLPVEVDALMVADRLATVERFRVYQSSTYFLLDLKLEGRNGRLMKVPKLNQSLKIPDGGENDVEDNASQ